MHAWAKGHTRSHHFMSYFLRSQGCKSVPCSVKAHVGMEPHAKTQPSPVCLLSSEVTATQALGLLASVSARTHVSDIEFVVEPVSIPQALYQNPSIV